MKRNPCSITGFPQCNIKRLPRSLLLAVGFSLVGWVLAFFLNSHAMSQEITIQPEKKVKA
ncbi:MFS superfamily EmrB/QacA family protein [Lacticaseibacillus rhamnosus MTCC 5462]|nr:MFS superfamily EmrB/QacA family protein [Lacticaseibacillus rhamnosus MTCC 5462]